LKFFILCKEIELQIYKKNKNSKKYIFSFFKGSSNRRKYV
jgi:hypothetical protein